MFCRPARPLFAAFTPAFLATIAIASAASAKTPIEPPGPGQPGPLQLYAIQEPNLFAHTVGLLRLQITNLGLVGNPFEDTPNAGWRGGEYLYLAGPWIGAIGSDGEPHVSTSAPIELRPGMSPVWTIYESFEGAAHGNRIGGGNPFLADDDGDGLLDEDFQDGFDNDGDSRIDEDFAAAGQQMLSCVYTDNQPEAIGQIEDHIPLDIQVNQRSFQWSVPGINEFVGLEYEVVNIGSQNLTGVVFGWLSDSDVGIPTVTDYHNDDVVGWDTFDSTWVDPGQAGPCSNVEVSVNAAFMWDAPGGGDDVPGVFGTQILDHPTDPTGLRAPPEVGIQGLNWYTHRPFEEPTTDADRYAALTSSNLPTKNPLPGVATGSSGGSGDYRYLLSTGTLQSLAPGESFRVAVSQVIGDGFAAFRENAGLAQKVYNGFYLDADGNPNTGTDGMETCLRVLEPGDSYLWVDPCDSLATPFEINSTECLWVDADCNPCTGTNGREFQLHWVGTVAPPYPGTNLDPALRELNGGIMDPAGNGAVTLQWDNAPECWRSNGLDIFEGYRVYRTESEGSVPAPEDFVEIGEFRRNVVEGSEPLRSIRVPMDPIDITEDGCPIYPIGRYQFTDLEVVNDRTYFYSVVSFGVVEINNPDTGNPELMEIAALPFSPESFSVTPCDTCDLTVPIKLGSFSAERTGDGVALSWTTLGAPDHAGFHVHRELQGVRIRLTQRPLTGQVDFRFLDRDPPASAVDYWLEEEGRAGTSTWHGPVSLAAQGPVLSLGHIQPNPMTAEARLTYTLPEARRARIEVFDLQGRRIRSLLDRDQGPGEYEAEWDGRSDSGSRVSAGFYLLRFQAGDDVLMRRVIVSR